MTIHRSFGNKSFPRAFGDQRRVKICTDSNKGPIYLQSEPKQAEEKKQRETDSVYLQTPFISFVIYSPLLRRPSILTRPQTNNSQVTLKAKVLDWKDAKQKTIGKIGIFDYQTHQTNQKAKPYFVTGLDHPSIMFKTFHNQIASRRKSDLISIDLPGNGASGLFEDRAITAKDQFDASVQAIQQTSHEQESIQLLGMSMGSVPVLMITNLYANHPEEFKKILGDRTLEPSLLFVPIPNQELVALGSDVNKAFLFHLFRSILFKGKMEWDYEKNSKEFFLSHHSPSDQKYLREIISCNSMPMNPLTVLSFPNEQNKISIIDLVERGYLRIVFHDQDQVFTVEDLAGLEKIRGIYKVPGGHSAGTGKDISEDYIEGVLQAMDEKKPQGDGVDELKKQYSRWRYKPSAGIRLGIQEATAFLNFDLLYGVKMQRALGIALYTDFLGQVGINWQKRGTFSFRPALGLGIEFWRQPIRLRAFAANDFKTLFGKKSSIKLEPQGGFRLEYTALELMELSLETSLGKSYSLDMQVEKNTQLFFNFALRLGFLF